MTNGMLSISLDPPLIGFTEKGESSGSGKRTRWRNSSPDEIRNLLLALKKISLDQKWPPRDCLLRMCGDFVPDALAKFGLLELGHTQASPSAMTEVGEPVIERDMVSSKV